MQLYSINGLRRSKQSRCVGPSLSEAAGCEAAETGDIFYRRCRPTQQTVAAASQSQQGFARVSWSGPTHEGRELIR